MRLGWGRVNLVSTYFCRLQHLNLRKYQPHQTSNQIKLNPEYAGSYNSVSSLRFGIFISGEAEGVINTVINRELERIIDEAIEKEINTVEIIPGKGSGQLKKRSITISGSKAHQTEIS